MQALGERFEAREHAVHKGLLTCGVEARERYGKLMFDGVGDSIELSVNGIDVGLVTRAYVALASWTVRSTRPLIEASS